MHRASRVLTDDVCPLQVVIIGGGIVGTNATQMAVGMGADVVVLDRSPEALRRLNVQFGSRVKGVFSTRESIERVCGGLQASVQVL